MRRHRRPAQPTQFVGVFDLFKIGIGPSSSHTVGPMRAANEFIAWAASHPMPRLPRIVCHLFGSLALTGSGHGTDIAVIAGLAGKAPETIDPDEMTTVVEAVRSARKVNVGGCEVDFDPYRDIRFHKSEFLKGHPNALKLAIWSDDDEIIKRVYYSVGGGFIQVEGSSSGDAATAQPRYPFQTAEELLAICRREGLSIAKMSRVNELGYRSGSEIDAGLNEIWSAMNACINRGLRGAGILPGGLRVRRRAASLHAALLQREKVDQGDPLRAMEWVNLFALAVNEENAAGGRVVTAPTNGAAGIIPAVIRYYVQFVGNAGAEGIQSFLLTASAIGSIIKRNASISGADVGCQGEVGSAAAMAAAGLAAALGGSNAQVENAAEIALEHNLGLTCDPIGGLVQIPCIERNAVAAVKAINAARLALHGDGDHRVSLDQAIETMRQTGRDMKRKYKETSLGGLAVNVPIC